MWLVNFIHSRLDRLYFCNGVLLTGPFEILPHYFLRIEKRSPALHSLGYPRKDEVEYLVEKEPFPHWIPTVEVIKRLLDDLLKLRNFVTAVGIVGFLLRGLSDVLFGMHDEICKCLTRSFVVLGLFITHISR